MSVLTKDERRKVYVKTYGCQMNVYDSARMEDALAHEGFEPTADMEDADLVLLNTCHIREKAAEKVYSEIGRIRKIKDARVNTDRPLTLGVTGCVAQAEGREIMVRAPSVDLVAGPQTYHRIGAMVREAEDGRRPVQTGFEIEEKFADLGVGTPAQIKARGVAAFLTVQEGCDKFCTFCVVPYTRGAEVSRPVSQILEEAKQMAEAGVREITLLGQNVNAWHGKAANGKSWRLGELLFALSEIEGIERLRYTTSHPVDMDDSLFEAHRNLPKLMPYLHLPVQSGSDRILRAMNRRHTASDYLRLIGRMREVRHDIAISGDMIVGFPGETDEDFEATMALAKKVEYASCFSFKYSPRPGTPGADLPNQVPEAIKSHRLAKLQDLLNSQQLSFNRSCVGKTCKILLEKPGRRSGQLIGRSPWLQSVVVEASLGEPGQMVHVEITGAAPNSLTGAAL